MPKLKLDEALVAKHANDPRYAHTFWHFPKEHPIRLHDGPGIVALVNPKRKRAYVLAGRTQTAYKASEGLIGRLRHYIRDLNGDAHHKPYDDPSKPAPRPTSLDLPHDLAWDWSEDLPTTFVWLLAFPFPPRWWREFGLDKQGRKEYDAAVNTHKRRVEAALEQKGFVLYNPPRIRGLAAPGARMARLDQMDALRDERVEFLRNHLDWSTLLAPGSIGLAPEHDPMEHDVQRAYARYQVGIGQPAPKPGDAMRGHKQSDTYKFHLPEGQMTLNCPPGCPRYVYWSVEQADA